MFIKKLIRKRFFLLVGCFMLVLVNLQGIDPGSLRAADNAFQRAGLGKEHSLGIGALFDSLGILQLLHRFAAKNLNKIGKEAEEIKAVPVGLGEGELEEKRVPAGRGQGVSEAKHVAPEEKKAVQIFPTSPNFDKPGDSATERLIQELFHSVQGDLHDSSIVSQVAFHIKSRTAGVVMGVIGIFAQLQQESK